MENIKFYNISNCSQETFDFFFLIFVLTNNNMNKIIKMKAHIVRF